jgi:hemicentin
LRLVSSNLFILFQTSSGVPAHILLKCTGLDPPGHLSHVELVSGAGRTLRTLPVPLPSDLGSRGLWSLPQFRTPSQSFFVKATGKDDAGYRFQRLSSVSYTNIIPGKTTGETNGHFPASSTHH